MVTRLVYRGISAEKAENQLGRLTKLKTHCSDYRGTEESEQVEKEDTNMTKEEQNIIKEALSPVTTRLEVIEKAMAETETPEGKRKSSSRTASKISEADATEKVHGVSNKIGTDTVEKKDEFFLAPFLAVTNKTNNRKGIKYGTQKQRSIIAKAAIDTTTIATYGKLNPEQADKFIDYMVDNSPFLKDIQTVKMGGPEYDLDFIGVSSRIIRKGQEATAPTNQAGVTTSTKRLTSTEIILPQDISFSFLGEDNIEKGNAEDHIAKLPCGPVRQRRLRPCCKRRHDSERRMKTSLKLETGSSKKAKASLVAHVFDTDASVDYKGVVFAGMLDKLPNKHKVNLGELRYYVSPNVASAYIEQLTTRQTAWADEASPDRQAPPVQGSYHIPVQYWPDDCIILTPRKNLATGVQRYFTFPTARGIRASAFIEFTMTNRVAPAEIVYDDALVVGYNAS